MYEHTIHIFGLLAAIACALLVMHFRDLLSCALALGGCGFFVAWVYFAVKAPDLGVVQLVIEVIKMCVLIIVVAKTNRIGFSAEPRRTRLLVAAALTLLLFSFVFVALPPISPYGGSPSELAQRYVESGESETGSANIVTSILLGFRAYDTLGEVCVLFVSIVGISHIMKRGRKRRET